jgi:DNA helicase-2/ATP-dependent DNA helicase PcrA
MKIDYLKELNNEQYEAVTTINGPLLIIAGAGTGKTRTIVYRAAYLIEMGIPSTQILMLTFTNKAANEMKTRVIDLLGEEQSKGLTACTFHSFCASMLRRYAKYANLSPLFTILASGDDVDIINMKKSEDQTHKYDKQGFPPSSKIADIISQSINRNISIEDLLEEDKFCRYQEFLYEIMDLKELSDNYKKENSMLNYDDLLLAMNELLEKNPMIATEISNIYQYIMVDEYQDTNVLQDNVLFQLRKENKNIAVVGDDLQSLYAFRGAEVQNIINFPKKIDNCKIVYLIQNYRSNQEILDLSNHIVKFATEGYKKKLVGSYNSLHKPIVYTPYSQIDETKLAMELIQNTHSQGVSYNEICVLARNSSLSTMLEMELNKQRINYVKYGGPKFFDLEYVKDVLAYLRVLTRTKDEIAWFRILKVHSGIGDMNAKKIAASCKEEGMEHLLDKKYSKRKYASELQILYDELKKVKQMELTPLLTEIIYFYIGTMKRNIENMKTDEGKRTAYLESNEMHENELMSLIPITESYKTITSFLDDLTLDNTKLTHIDAEDGQVVISTIHSVKGLEYDTVIILDCIDEIFPSTTSMNEGTKEDNEELRCFYVAVTRAKENLYLLCPKSAMKYNKRIFGRPAHYLRDGNIFYQYKDYNNYNNYDNYY